MQLSFSNGRFLPSATAVRNRCCIVRLINLIRFVLCFKPSPSQVGVRNDDVGVR